MWRVAGNDSVDFLINANSRHFRKSATTLAHLYGDGDLRATTHDALNHAKETNHSNYQNCMRRHVVTNAKLKLKQLCKAGIYLSMLNPSVKTINSNQR